MNTGGNDLQRNTFDIAILERGLQDLASLYEHDYRPAMPDLKFGESLTNEREIDRIGRLAGVALKKSVARPVPAQFSDTGSKFGYEFRTDRLDAPGFKDSEVGKAYYGLLEQTKSMMEQGERSEIAPDVIEEIYALPLEKRAGRFAMELAFEGQTFRQILRAVRFVTCKASVRSAIAALLVTQIGTSSTSAATVAGFLTTNLPWLAFCPQATLAAIVLLVTVVGVEGFCDWSKTYLAKYSKTEDVTDPVLGKNG